MNNTLCLGIFAALVYLRDLKWYYSAGQSYPTDQPTCIVTPCNISKFSENTQNHRPGDNYCLDVPLINQCTIKLTQD